jgi:hypothetical protein
VTVDVPVSAEGQNPTPPFDFPDDDPDQDPTEDGTGTPPPDPRGCAERTAPAAAGSRPQRQMRSRRVTGRAKTQVSAFPAARAPTGPAALVPGRCTLLASCPVTPVTGNAEARRLR